MVDRENKGSGTSMLLAVLTGAGIVAAALIVTRRVKGAGASATLDSVIESCDRAAQALEERMQAAMAFVS